MTPHNLRSLLLSSLFFFLSQAAFGQDTTRYYDIELVVFEALEESAETSETWPTGKMLEVPENSAILGRKFEGKLPPEYDPNLLFKQLPSEDYKLQDEAKMLGESEKYRLLLHTGWRQPGLSQKEAITLYINHAIGEDKGQFEPEPARADGAEPVDNQTTEAPAAQTEPQPAARVEGLFTIVLSRYLHLNAEMLYTKELTHTLVDMFDISFLEDRAGKDNIFYLKQNRRMRSKETHYIDHPKFGMLVRITPYDRIVNPPPPPGKPATLKGRG